MTGTDAATYTRERPGMSAFVLEDGVVYHTYSTYSRGLDGIWGMYQWLDRAPLGRNETGPWWRRHDEYGGLSAVDVMAHASQQRLLGVSALLFAASAAVTVAWCASMSAMGGMPMPGGWTMSMAWMRMPGQTWPGAAASFLGMWAVMMVAMMLPSCSRCCGAIAQAVGDDRRARLGRLTALVGAGYFFVWTAFGVAVFPFGVALAEVAMQQPPLARAVPIGDRRGRADRRRAAVHRVEGAPSGLLPGAPGTTARCRPTPARPGATACASGSSAPAARGLTAILLVVGVMDLARWPP